MKLLIAACALLTGCVSPTLRVELEHVSHPLAGFPVERQKWSEDDVTQASVLLHWEDLGWYVDAGVGYNLQGKNGGGFYGPAMTGTMRVGKEFKLW